jgi:lysophospholipase L1-like esterase
MKKWLERLGLLVLGLILALVLAEILTRIFWKNLAELDHNFSISFVTLEDYKKAEPPKFIWPGQVGNVKEFYVESTRNHLKFHDTEHSFEKPEDTFRIIILGDSMVEAMQVPLEKAFHKVLESRLKEKMEIPVEVISFGRSGSGAVQNYVFLKTYGIKYDPDLVIMQFLSNDLIDDSPAMRKEYREQMRRRGKYVLALSEIYSRYLLLKWSRFNQILALKMARLYQSHQSSKYSSYDKYGFIYLNALVFADEFSEMWEKPWRRTKRYILNVQDLCRESGAEMILVSFAEFWRLGKIPEIERKMKAMNRESMKYQWDFSKTDSILLDFCSKNNIRFLSLLPIFRKEYQQKRKRLHYSYDMHLNEYGHEVAAEAVFDYLKKKSLLHKKIGKHDSPMSVTK